MIQPHDKFITWVRRLTILACVLTGGFAHAASVSAPAASADGNYTVTFSECQDPYSYTAYCYLEESADGGTTWSVVASTYYDFYSGYGYASQSGRAAGAYRYHAVQYDYSTGATSWSNEVIVIVGSGTASAWSLTNDQRRAYLYYYAPVIFKRANENGGKQGYDWITNYYFDQDGAFSTNRYNWLSVPNLVSAAASGNSAYASWRLRPTLYTAAMEFMDGTKNLILIYHVYHAMDSESKIHDWERIEIHLKGLVGSPGTGEYVDHAVVTQHNRDVVRSAADLQFMTTGNGKHLMIWQAEWSVKYGSPHGQELRFVRDTWAYIQSRMAIWNSKAEVAINNDNGRKNVHYVFVPDQASGAVNTWNATPLSYTTAEKLASGLDNGSSTSWTAAKRVQYELQDLADIVRSHWQYGGYAAHWNTDSSEAIQLDGNSVVNEAGEREIPPGLHTFYTRSRDYPEPEGDGRRGYVSKQWWWGTFNLNDNASDNQVFDSNGGILGNLIHDLLGGEFAMTDSRGNSRTSASGLGQSVIPHWWQHDYFVHYGYTDGSEFTDPGFWLPGAWYNAENGGFDGRWVQLFDDRAGQENYAPLRVYFDYPYDYCSWTFPVTAHVSGGTNPYTVTWNSGYGVSQTSAPHSSGYFDAYVAGSVTVQSADGQQLDVPFYFETWCPDYWGP